MPLEIKNSDRLSYALMTENDADLLFELDQNPEVMRYINGGSPSTRDEIENKYIPRMMSYRDPIKGWGIWSVTLTNTCEFIGWVLVRPMNFFNEQRNDEDLELGWRFKQTAWGQGYATEAATTVMNALEASGTHQFTAIADEANIASTNLMKRLGMTYVKTGLHKDPLGDAMVVYYSRKVASKKIH